MQNEGDYRSEKRVRKGAAIPAFVATAAIICGLGLTPGVARAASASAEEVARAQALLLAELGYTTKVEPPASELAQLVTTTIEPPLSAEPVEEQVVFEEVVPAEEVVYAEEEYVEVLYAPATSDMVYVSVEDLLWMGVVDCGGWRYTYYQEHVLPGGGLDIPGRHHDGGRVVDGDGYVCVASSDLPYGTVVDTPVGMGKVYDTGCDHGIIDIYLV